MASKRLILVLILVSFAVTPAISATSMPAGKNPCLGEKKYIATELDESVGLHSKYTVQFDEDEKQICIKRENKGKGKALTSVGILVDGRGISPGTKELEENESSFFSKNVTEYIDATADNHTISINAGSKDLNFNFTHHINTTAKNSPTPKFTDLEIVRDSGDKSILIATVHNPGKRAYALHVQAETFETEGAFEIGAPQPGNTSEFQIPLNEGANEVVAGKVMVFNDTGSPDGKFDQKEFMAKPNETANAWDDHFEQVPGERADVSYDNETARQYREGYVDDEALSPLERRAGAVLVVFALVGAVLWRRSR